VIHSNATTTLLANIRLGWKCITEISSTAFYDIELMGLYHPLDGVTNLKYKLLYFLTPNKKISKRKALAFNWDRCCHLVICLRLILFHYSCKKFLSIGAFYLKSEKNEFGFKPSTKTIKLSWPVFYALAH
jgi:hypothetical protein